MLRNAEVIDDDNVSGDIITVGSKVRIWDTDLEEEVDYAIVGSAEADPMNTENAKISNESPVGRGLLGHKVGDTVEIETPGGIVELKVLADFQIISLEVLKVAEKIIQRNSAQVSFLSRKASEEISLRLYRRQARILLK